MAIGESIGGGAALQSECGNLKLERLLGVAFDASLYYVRDADHLVKVMGTNPSYLQTMNARQRSQNAVRNAYGAFLPSASTNFGTSYRQGKPQFFAEIGRAHV